MNSSPAASLFNLPVNETQEKAAQKTKPEQEFSKILNDKTHDREAKQNQNDKAKEELRLRKSGELERQFNPLQRFLYDLAYRDPASWSIADREQYHVQSHSAKSLDLFRVLKATGLSGRAVSKSQPAETAKIQIKQERGSDLDSAPAELSAQAQNTAPNRRGAFGDIKTSLQEIANANRVSENQIVESLIRQIAIRKLNQGSEVRLTLNPEALGEVKLALFVRKNELAARFQTADAEVGRLLNNHLAELNQALQKQGLNVKTLDVATQNFSWEERYV